MRGEVPRLKGGIKNEKLNVISLFKGYFFRWSITMRSENKQNKNSKAAT
jgi:hypothetical protein